MINRLFDKLSKKVQINNRIVSKQIRGINYKDEDIENHPDFNNFQSNVIVPFNV